MKTSYSSIFAALLVLLLFLSANDASAQRVVKVASGVGTLNQAINGDTTSAGARKDLTTIYELDKGGYYITMGTIENRNYHLRIRAAAGTGKRPIIRPGVVSGGSSSRPFSARGDLTLDGVYVTNLDEQNGIKQYIIQLSADSLRLSILNSHLDREGQIAIRCDGKNPRIVIKNSIISNVGTMASPSNGRGVDDRGNDIDTLIYENNTFYNLTSRILRDGGGVIKYCYINHNTVVNSGQMGCTIGPVINGYFTNNLFFNTGFLGTDSATTDWYTFQTAPLTQAWLNQGYVQKLQIHHNNFYVSPELISGLPAKIRATTVLDSNTQAAIKAGGWTSLNTNLPVVFKTPPQVPLQVMKSFYDTTVTVKPEMDKSNGSPDYGGTQMPFDFSYPTTSPLYTAGTNGEALGDRTYFGIQVGVANDAMLPTNYQLYSNYPNPFNPSTNIRYSLPVAGSVKLEIVNTLGQTVNTLVNQNQQAGTYSVVWDGRDMNGRQVSTGMYIYRLKTANSVLAKKMILLK
ncbi:MAG: T9SS type A sorting domain-containing protein [Ignavibacteriales bacterium]|nr:T9SS type A sorting domain-containing protein [Ignavibacteriales bacterium]